MNFYKVLNVSTNATEKDIKKAYRLLAKKYHPDTYIGDKAFAENKMQEINIAYDTLSNSKLRKEYDEKFGFNVKVNYEQTTKSTNYYKERYTNNPYNKDGVNYDVRYRPNNSRIKYDSNGYAESNYSTYDNSKSWKSESDFSVKNIKEKLKGKNLTYTIVLLIFALIVVSITLYKAVDSISDFLDSTQGVYNKVNSVNNSNFTNDTANNKFKEDLYPQIKDKIDDVKSTGKELLETYKKETENKSKQEILNDWGITNKEDQKMILDLLEQLNQNN